MRECEEEDFDMKCVKREEFCEERTTNREGKLVV